MTRITNPDLKLIIKKPSKIKISKKLDSMEDPLFLKKKMAKGAKMLSAGLPKLD